MIFPAKFLRVALATAAVSCLCVVGASAASLGVGTVTADALRLRDSASTNGTILATAPKGETVIILEDAGNNWYKVDYDSVQGYMSGEYLTIAQKADVAIGYGQVSTDGAVLNVRSGPGTGYAKVTTLSNGTVVQITGIDNGWYKITYNGTSGYVSSDYMITVKSSAGSRGDATTTTASSSLGQQIVDYAKQFLGTRLHPQPHRHRPAGQRHCGVQEPAPARRPGLLQQRLYLQARVPRGHLHRQRPVHPRLHQPV